MEQALVEDPPKTAQERAALDQAYRASRGMFTKWQNDVRGIAEAKIVELSGAGLYMSCRMKPTSFVNCVSLRPPATMSSLEGAPEEQPTDPSPNIGLEPSRHPSVLACRRGARLSDLPRIDLVCGT